MTGPAGYEKLAEVLSRAIDQAAFGKGKERHSSGEPFREQPICVVARWVGIGAQLGQAIKKTRESVRLLEIKGKEAAVFELLGAINWLAAAVIVIEEISELSSETKCQYCGCASGHYPECKLQKD